MPNAQIAAVETFVRGLASRDAGLATRHVSPDRYVEHNPRVAEGVEGLRHYVRSLPDDHRLEVLRRFQDGPFVVVQAQGKLGGNGVFFDVFRLEGDAIVEHWAFSSPGGPPNASGHTQSDGPAAPRHEDDTGTNKAIVQDYYETVHIAGRHDQIRRFMAGDVQIRHEPGVEDGVAAFERDLAIITRGRTIDEIKLLLGQGDFVFIAAQGTHEGEPCAYVDLYRVEDGKLAEHWGFPEPIPPAADRRNDNGML